MILWIIGYGLLSVATVLLACVLLKADKDAE